MITIEFWSDYACPFCYIGKRRLEAALSQYDGAVTIIHKSFQLNTQAEKVAGIPYAVLIGQKYGIPQLQAQQNIDNLVAMAKSVGLSYNLDHLIHNNTKNAHRLTKYAAVSGKADAMEERLLKAYFTESMDIGDLFVLTTLAKEIGLGKDATAAILASDRFCEEVSADQIEAHQKGIFSVPHFIINESAISGAQSEAVFLEALHNAAAFD